MLVWLSAPICNWLASYLSIYFSIFQAGNLNERNQTTESSEMQQTGNLIGETLNRDCTIHKVILFGHMADRQT